MSLSWALALRAVARRPLRSALTTAAVALAIAVVLGVLATGTGLDGQARATALASAGLSQLDVRVGAGQGLAAEDAARLGTLPGVADLAPLYQKRVLARLSPADLDGATVSLLALRDGRVALRSLSLAAGRLPRPQSGSEVVLDSALAAELATTEHRPPVRLGDRVELTTSLGPDAFTVVGFSNGTGLGGYTRSSVFVTEAAMLDRFRLGLRTALVALRLRTTATPASVAAEVRGALGPAVTVLDPRQPAAAPLGEVAPVLAVVTLLGLLAGAGSAANTAALSASERRREIALLRAGGAATRQVTRFLLVEAGLLVAVAVPLGVVLGWFLAALLVALLTPPDLAAPAVAASPLQVLVAVAVGVAASLAGAWLPARAAGHRPILSGLRSHPDGENEKLTPLPVGLAVPLVVVAALLFALGGATAAALATVCLVAGVACSLPVLAPVVARAVGAAASLLTPAAAGATRSLLRRRNRTALTVAGLTVAVASAVAMTALDAGSVAGGDAWVSHLFAGSVLVRAPVTQTDAVAASIAAAPGVGRALPLRLFSVASGGDVVGVTAIDTASYETAGALDVESGDRAAAFRAIGDGAAVLAPAALAAAHGWVVGSSVPLATTRGTRGFTVAAVVAHSYPAGDGQESLIVDRAQARAYFGSEADGFDDLDVAAPGGAGAVAAAVAPFGLSAVSVDDIRSAAASALQHSLALLSAVSLVALVISMTTVVNTLLVNVRQQTRELSLLRAVGLTRRGVRRMVVTEAAILAATGAVVGVLTGCAMVAGMLRSVATPGFAPGFAFPVAAALVLAATVVLASALVVLPPAARFARSSIVAAIRQD